MSGNRLERPSIQREKGPDVILDDMAGSRTVREALKNAPDAVSMGELIGIGDFIKTHPESDLAKEAHGLVLYGGSDGNFAPSLYGPNASFDLQERTFTLRGWFSYDRVVRRGPKAGS